MHLDFDQCERARRSRDPRFDGKFFVAVRTTGIYCRPICPAPQARRSHVTFFQCAAAAEEAGFRPCLRCHPESAPGTPAWSGTSATVSRALRLISDGALDRGSVKDLSRRLGVGDRHLRRLFVEHLGATPRAIARTRRVHFAGRLLVETDLPMCRVADSAGFSSLRRFNALVREEYAKSPTALRRMFRRADPSPARPGLTLRLSFRPPFDWASLLRFLRARATDGVESVDDRAYRRSVSIGRAAGIIEVRRARSSNDLLLHIRTSEMAPLHPVVERVRRIFDLSADPREIEAHLGNCPRLRKLVEKRPGLRVPGCWDPFELGIRAILGQQVRVRTASKLAARLARKYGEPLVDAAGGEVSLLFPRPEALLHGNLEEIGITRVRARAIRSFSEAFCDGRLGLDGAVDLDDVIALLTDVPGIGRWTAHYIAMRAFKEPDAFPSDDVGLRRAASSKGERMTAANLERMAGAWRPWRAYAAMHLWNRAAEGEDQQ